MMLGDAGREGVRQEAQGPVPAVTQNCRETSEGSVHGFSSHPCRREADQPQADP